MQSPPVVLYLLAMPISICYLLALGLLFVNSTSAAPHIELQPCPSEISGAECGTLEGNDPTRLAVGALLRISRETLDDPLVFETGELTRRTNELAEELDR